MPKLPGIPATQTSQTLLGLSELRERARDRALRRRQLNQELGLGIAGAVTQLATPVATTVFDEIRAAKELKSRQEEAGLGRQLALRLATEQTTRAREKEERERSLSERAAAADEMRAAAELLKAQSGGSEKEVENLLKHFKLKLAESRVEELLEKPGTPEVKGRAIEEVVREQEGPGIRQLEGLGRLRERLRARQPPIELEGMSAQELERIGVDTEQELMRLGLEAIQATPSAEERQVLLENIRQAYGRPLSVVPPTKPPLTQGDRDMIQAMLAASQGFADPARIAESRQFQAEIKRGVPLWIARLSEPERRPLQALMEQLQPPPQGPVAPGAPPLAPRGLTREELELLGRILPSIRK